MLGRPIHWKIEKRRRGMGFAIAKRRRFFSAAGAGLALVALGCASGPPKSGFLSDYPIIATAKSR